MMMKLLKNIRTYWFIKVDPKRLALLRIATGCFSLWYLLSRFDMLQKMAGSDMETFRPTGVLGWMDQPLMPEVFLGITVALIALNIAYIIGWKFRFTGPVFAIGALLYFTYRNSWSMLYHNRNALILHIVILGLVASADALSWDSWKRGKNKMKPRGAHWQYGWPIQLICAVTVGSYFLSGVAKLAGDLAWEWANGTAMRSQVAVDALRKEVLGSEAGPLFNLIFEHTWLFLIMGILTFLLELGAPLAMVKRKWGMVWAVFTWMMHWGIFFIMGIRFRYQMSGLLFLSFFDIEKVLTRKKKISQMGEGPEKSTDTSVVLFDGVCSMCNSWVRFILKREKYAMYQFASLQSETGKRLLEAYGLSEQLSSIVLIHNGKVYQKSDAVLQICKNLKKPWSWSKMLWVVPKMLRDRVYDYAAANRYNWFGKQEQCELPDAPVRIRFLDSQNR